MGVEGGHDRAVGQARVDRDRVAVTGPAARSRVCLGPTHDACVDGADYVSRMQIEVERVAVLRIAARTIHVVSAAGRGTRGTGICDPLTPVGAHDLVRRAGRRVPRQSERETRTP